MPRKGSRSSTRKGLFDYTTKFGNLFYHQKGHNVRKTHRPYSRQRKGSFSKTMKGMLDFSTKKISKVFHRNGHYTRKTRRPYHK